MSAEPSRAPASPPASSVSSLSIQRGTRAGRRRGVRWGWALLGVAAVAAAAGYYFFVPHALDVQTASVSTSEGGKSTSVSMRTERILPPDAIRALSKGRVLLFATGIRVAMLDLKPWYQSPSAKVIGPASARATKAITERAVAKVAGPDMFGPTV